MVLDLKLWKRFFSLTVPYQLRKHRFLNPILHSVFSGTESMKFLGSKVLEVSPHETKQLQSLKDFKKARQQ